MNCGNCGSDLTETGAIIRIVGREIPCRLTKKGKIVQSSKEKPHKIDITVCSHCCYRENVTIQNETD